MIVSINVSYLASYIFTLTVTENKIHKQNLPLKLIATNQTNVGTSGKLYDFVKHGFQTATKVKRKEERTAE